MLTITNEVPETDYDEWARGTTYGLGDCVMLIDNPLGWSDMVEPSAFWWMGIACHASRNVYGVGVMWSVGDVWDPFLAIQSFGQGSFVSTGAVIIQPAGLLGSGNNWLGIAIHKNGNVYAIAGTSGIYMQTGGAGGFTLITGTDGINWQGICCCPTSGNVYASAWLGDVYKQTSGAGSFVDIGATHRMYANMCACIDGDVYVGGASGHAGIYKRTAESGDFVSLGAAAINWHCFAEDPTTGDVYAGVYDGGIYKQTGGSGSFNLWNSTSKYWTGLAFDSLGNMYASAYGGGLYYNAVTTGSYHHNYQSLIAGNRNYHPALNPTQWLDLGATNRLRPFDKKTGSQATKATPMVYHVAPGAPFNSVAILNCDNTSVRIQTDASYDRTISTLATDIVLTDLDGGSGTHLTVTVNKTAGTAKLGELVIGNSQEIGTMLYAPEVGITDYSIKEVDEWGNWSVTERAYSKRLSCILEILNTDLDEIFNLLAGYRAVALVWRASTNYSCLTVYGYWKDFSVVIGSRTYSRWSLQVEGLT